MLRAAILVAMILSGAAPAFAQDIKGIEICTHEKQMDRRTSCLQSNVEYLQQKLSRSERDAQEKLSAAQKEIAALKEALASLKDALSKTQRRVDELEKPKTEKK